MPSPPLSNTFEGGSDETTITVANSGGGSGDAFTSVGVPTGGQRVYDSAQFANGSLSARFNCPSGANDATNYVQWDSLGSPGTIYGRCYLRLGANTEAHRFMWCNQADYIEIIAGPTLRVTWVAGGSTSDPLSLNLTEGTWYRLEWKIIFSDTVGETTLNVYEGHSETLWDSCGSGPNVDTISSGTLTAMGLGQTHSGKTFTNAQEFWVDEFALATDDWIGPASSQTPPYINVTIS